MSGNELRNRVRSTIATHLDVSEDKIKDDSRFTQDLDLDSLDTVDLVMSIEEDFGLTIPDEDAEKLVTVKDVVDYIEEKLSPASK